MDSPTTTNVAELRNRPHYSYSAMSLFMSCSLAYRFRYVDRLPSEHSPKCLLFGSAFHRTLDRIAAAKQDNRSTSTDDAKAIFKGEWMAQIASAVNPDFESDTEPQEMLRQGQLMIETYLEAWKDKKILSHAQGFILDILDSDGKPLSKPIVGEYDLVVEQDGKPLIVDFKSAGRKWDEDKPHKDLQATLYCLSYHRSAGVIPGFRFDVVTKTKTPCVYQLATSRTEDDFARFSKLYHCIDKAIQAGAFLPNESSFMCSGCEYASACASWHRPSP